MFSFVQEGDAMCCHSDRIRIHDVAQIIDHIVTFVTYVRIILSYFWADLHCQPKKQNQMIREVVKIDEDLCDGCGVCVPGCHEGALQVIDGKARLISELMCDGLGACMGHCPQNAIAVERREAEPYDERKVMEVMAGKGINTVIAHLRHLKDHNESEYLKEGMDYLSANRENLDFELEEVVAAVHGKGEAAAGKAKVPLHAAGGCPGSRAMVLDRPVVIADEENGTIQPSALGHWPVQMHLINPSASCYRGADVLVAADCTAFSLGNFHRDFLKGKSLAIACPKLDSNLEVYVEKIRQMADQAQVNTFTVMIMQVPCCRGLLQIVQGALSRANRKVPVKAVVVSVEGDILQEEWL